ncbi:MAG: WYL domain-containing protein [Erysipelotrichaceae bacterium]
MNRTAQCLRMLQLLKSKGMLTKKQLSIYLETNVRNIGEFRKECEVAGYDIEIIPGRYGGYKLAQHQLLMVPKFINSEKKSIQEAIEYLNAHTDFLYLDTFNQAMQKLVAGMRDDLLDKPTYRNRDFVISKAMRKQIDDFELAKTNCVVIELLYQAMNAKEASIVKIHPYEILNYKGAYYGIAYSLKAKDYRVFKFSDERMKNLKLTNQTFIRDKDYKSSEHIGQIGLVKDEVYELDLIIYDESAILVREQSIGLNPKMEWLDQNKLHFSTIMEGKLDVLSFILSLGDQVIINEPLTLKKELQLIIKKMVKNYNL